MKQENFANYGDLFIRVVAGLIFVFAGFGKLFTTPGIEGFSGMLGSLGFPAATPLAIIVGIIELVGGILLILGLYTRIVASLLAVIIVIAILTVHLTGWNDVKYPLLLLAALIRYIGTPGFMNISKSKK